MKNSFSTLKWDFFKPACLIFGLFCFKGANAKHSKIDSLINVLKTQKDDTNKIITLNSLSSRLKASGKFDSALACANSALALAEKIASSSNQLLAKAGQKFIAGTHGTMGNIYSYMGDHPKSIEQYSKGLEIDKQIGDKKGIAHNLGSIGLAYWYQGNYAMALDYENKALEMYKEIGDKMGTAINLGNIADIYQSQGNYPKSLENNLKALTISQEINDKEGIGIYFANIATNYEAMNDETNAMEYGFKAMAIQQELGDKAGVASDLGNIGIIYRKQGKYSKALEYYRKGLSIKQEIGDKAGIAISLGNIGNIYQLQGDYVNALDYNFKALAITKEIGNKDQTALDFCTIGLIYGKQKNVSLANKYVDSALAISLEVGNKYVIASSYQVLALLDSATGNYKKGLEDYKKYIIYNDSLINEENTKKTVRAEMNYQFEQTQAKEKAEQEKKDAVTEQSRKKQIVIRNSFMGGFALMLALAFFIFRGYRQKQKANIIITQQKNEVEKQKALVENQKALVEEKNKDILDSITYAKRLQDAILPPLNLVKQYLPESFVMYKPKDIVAGDFYWMERAGDTILIAAADCTGHGVPGALVSVVCSNALNRTVKEFKITEPGKILDKVRELVLQTFEKSESNVQDGMDISLCCINTVTKEIQWSGAFNSLWYIQNGAMHEVPADKQPIGKFDNPIPFNTHNLKLQKDDALYLFTDGYADQFGGPKGKKFKYKQLQDLLFANASLPLEDQRMKLESELENWKGNHEQVDDILMIGIRV